MSDGTNTNNVTAENKNLIEGKTGLWEVVIGLEVHAQVASKSKLFEGSATAFGADPNTQVGYLSAGMPGMLPVINSYCVDQAIRTGLGFHGTVHRHSIFDRKNYFYADLPTGYQISQFTRPIVTGGYLDIDLEDGSTKRLNITRLHLEQDAGKSTHDLHPTKSFIDLNRAGVALMEIVSEPEMRSSAEAMAYYKKLRSLLRYLDTCDGNMEEGSMRADANISLRRPGAEFGTRAEIKNLNSVRFLGQAIDYEIQRQMAILEDGGVISQETRLFDPGKVETRSMRSKEDAHDYRYFPDPDLPPLLLTQERIDAMRDALPELPDAKMQRFVEFYHLSRYDASVLANEKEVAAFYEAGVAALKSPDKGVAAKMFSNWMLSEVFAAMNREHLNIADIPLEAGKLAELVDLIQDGTISGKIAKDVFLKMWETQEAPGAIVEKLGLRQISDVGALEAIVHDLLAKEADKVAQYKGGKEGLFGFFVGQVMKATQGKANPGMVNDLIRKGLEN